MRRVICKICNKEFETTHSAKMYCSSDCSREADKIRRIRCGKLKLWDKEAICAFCKKPFTKNTSNSKYCSNKCRLDGNRKKRLDIYYDKRCVDMEASVGDKVQCEMCGKEFALGKSKSMCCSKECLDLYNKELDDVSFVHGEGYRYVKYHPKKNINKDLDAKVKEAKRLGISYGQLQARMMLAGAC